jgi:4-amino-4-deoxy-L-arabinose transferase-like glycosyltransferase
LIVVTGLLLVRVLASLSGNGRVMLLGAGLFAGFLPLHAQLLGKNELALFVVLLLGIVNVLLLRERTALGVAALGILSGLAHLTRPSGVLLAIAVAAALWYESRPDRLAQRCRRVALVGALFCVTVLPWQIRNQREFGVWTMASSSTSGMNLLKGNTALYTQTFPWVTPDRLDPFLAQDSGVSLGDAVHKVEFKDAARLQQLALEGMLAAPGHTLAWAALKGAAFVSPLSIPLGSARIARNETEIVLQEFQPTNLLSQASYVLYTCLAYLGIAAAIRNWRQHSAAQRALYVFLASLAALLVAAHAVSYPLTRYRLPLDLLLLIPSALFLHAKLPSARANRA